MNSFFIAIVAIGLIQTGKATAPGADSELTAEAANRALVDAYQSAWNSHDMSSIPDLVTNEVDWVAGGGRGRGAERLQRGLTNLHSGKYKETVLTILDVDTAVLRPDLALVHIGWTLNGERDEKGGLVRPQEGLFTWVTVKDGPRWRIRSSVNSKKP